MVRPLAIVAVSAGLTAGLLAGQVPQPPTGVISGVVTDELNRPVPGVTVTAFRLSASGQFVEPASDPNNPFTARGAWARGAIQKETNDLGEFRLWPLETGEYVVAVVVNRVTRHVDENFGGCVPPYPGDWFGFVPVVRADPVEWLADASRRYLLRSGPGLTSPNEPSVGEHGYVTTFAPRATDLPDARRVTLTDKHVEAGVDVQLQLRPAVRVTGRIVGPKLPTRFDVELTSTRGGARTKTAADGSFVFLNTPVGSYTLISPGTSSDCDYIGNYGPGYQGRAEVTVERRDQNHFTLTVGPQTSVQRGPTQAPPSERMANAGSIEGVVTTDDGQPLDRVRLRVTSAALPKGATAVTTRDGRFAIDNLPPDLSTLTVSRVGFVDQIYGQRRRGGEGTLIQLGAGQRFTASVVMPRPGVIAGIVRNERGAPIPGVSVCCHVDSWTDADDRGQYRLWPVPAGDRTVLAYDARGRGVLRGYPRTYYPGVTDEAAAGKVRVDPGTVQAIDIDVRPTVAVPGAP
jgi:protocatechuate 3,4-dioxygenase beta subunit